MQFRWQGAMGKGDGKWNKGGFKGGQAGPGAVELASTKLVVSSQTTSNSMIGSENSNLSNRTSDLGLH